MQAVRKKEVKRHGLIQALCFTVFMEKMAVFIVLFLSLLPFLKQQFERHLGTRTVSKVPVGIRFTRYPSLVS